MITLNREIEAKDIKRLMLRVYKRYSSGAITEAKAYKEMYLLNSLLKVNSISITLNSDINSFKINDIYNIKEI